MKRLDDKENREQKRSAYIPLKPSEKGQIQEIADREGRSLGGQMRVWVLERLDTYQHQQKRADRAMSHLTPKP